MTDIIIATLIITSLVVFVLLAAAALLYMVVKIIMTGAFDNDDSLSDFMNKDENSDNDNQLPKHS